MSVFHDTDFYSLQVPKKPTQIYISFVHHHTTTSNIKIVYSQSSCWFQPTLKIVKVDHFPEGGQKKEEVFENTIYWLVVSTHLKNFSQNGNLLQVGMKIKKYLKPPPSLVSFVSNQHQHSYVSHGIHYPQKNVNKILQCKKDIWKKSTFGLARNFGWCSNQFDQQIDGCFQK